MSPMTLAAAQQVESGAELRIKFAGLTTHGEVRGDALEEYQSFFDEMPDGWHAIQVGWVEWRTDPQYKLPAWHVTNGATSIVAVEHETGVELLIAGVVVNVVSAGVLQLAKWAWRRWNERRATASFPKEPASFVIEVPRGGNGPPIRLVLPPPVSDDDIARFLRLALEVGNVT